jgi:hypothetical protein
MEADDGVEEGTCDRGGDVRVPERDEVHQLGEAINQHEYHGLVVDTWETLDDVHGDVRLDRRRYGEGLEQADQMKLFCLVALPCLDNGCRHMSCMERLAY